MLGVPVATLRTWEDRYGLVVPERTASRHRLFTRDQVEQLRFVKVQMDLGVSASDAHRLLSEHTGTPGPQRRAQPSDRPLILLADNDPFSAEFQDYFLKAEGFRTATALDYDSAVNAFEAGSPALVVVEILISGGLGLNLCRFLKDRKNPPRVLAVSSLESGPQAIEAGADAFLPKPLDPVGFMSRVNELMRSGPLVGQSEAM
jgi:DNA-binding transcriptional MerR regulator